MLKTILWEVKNSGRLEDKDCYAVVSFRMWFDCDIHIRRLDAWLDRENRCGRNYWVARRNARVEINARSASGVCDCICDSAITGFPVPDFEGFDKPLGKHNLEYSLCSHCNLGYDSLFCTTSCLLGTNLDFTSCG